MQHVDHIARRALTGIESQNNSELDGLVDGVGGGADGVAVLPLQQQPRLLRAGVEGLVRVLRAEPSASLRACASAAGCAAADRSRDRAAPSRSARASGSAADSRAPAARTATPRARREALPARRSRPRRCSSPRAACAPPTRRARDRGSSRGPASQTAERPTLGGRLST